MRKVSYENLDIFKIYQALASIHNCDYVFKKFCFFYDTSVNYVDAQTVEKKSQGMPYEKLKIVFDYYCRIYNGCHKEKDSDISADDIVAVIYFLSSTDIELCDHSFLCRGATKLAQEFFSVDDITDIWLPHLHRLVTILSFKAEDLYEKLQAFAASEPNERLQNAASKERNRFLNFKERLKDLLHADNEEKVQNAHEQSRIRCCAM